MKSIGIIAEYNPFHNGHLYHLNTIKEKYKDYTIILVMNGNFTERGETSILNKWDKTNIALDLGVDLVVELPYPFATQSADYFSYGAITLLEHLGVEKVIFGSESNNLEDLKLIAETQINNEDFEKLTKIYSKMGKNYPTSLSCALEDLTGKKIDTPNDLLGISYLKAIIKNNYKIIPETIKRTTDYHEKESTNNITSATAIRESIKNKQSVKTQVPEITNKYLTTSNLHFIEDYFPILKYKIITEEDLSIYQTVDEGIDKLLKKVINQATSLEELINLTKSKRYTYNKITRMLLHILCNFTKEKAKKLNEISYIRILGLNNKGRKYLNTVKKQVTIPIISKITKEKDKMLEFELETTKIYDLIHNENLSKREAQSLIYKND